MSIEYAIKKLYFEEYDQIVEVALSAQELIDCVGKEHGVTGKVCDGLPLAWAFDYVYENGIAYREFYHHTNKEEECMITSTTLLDTRSLPCITSWVCSSW